MDREIKVLENNLINKIAAGEVIERPASVVKELVENSIDAGATNITIEIKNGGTSFIKITDNGSGIKKEQVKTAFLRHATSKLQKLNDLYSILTLGFRGEALSSIASIAQVELITKTKQDSIGTKLNINGGNIISEEETSCLDGTCFTIKNIFFNTPARRKFLKKDSVESAYISEIITRLALGHSHISFKYINNNAIMLQTTGNSDLKNTVFNIYGKDIAKNMIYLEKEKDGFNLSGLICLPTLSRGNRTYENFFINGRFIKSSIVTNAIEEAYSDKIMIHKFPIFVLNLKVPENTVDVNVHPTKMEVRFEDEEFIFKFMKSSVEEVLKKEVLIPEIKTENESFSEVAKTTPFYVEKQKELENILLEEDEENFTPIVKPNVFIINESTENELKSIDKENKNDDYIKKYDNKNQVSEQKILNTNKLNKNDLKDNISSKSILKDNVYSENIPNKEILNEECQTKNILNENMSEKITHKNNFFNNYKIIGQIFGTYWIIEQENEMFMIDQHSAHEKVIYEDLIKKFGVEKIVSQRLIEPIIINVSDVEKSVIQENFEMLSNFGFGLEDFALNSYAIKEVPFIFKEPVEPKFFIEILDTLMDKNISNLYDMKIEKIISMSCKKAVKANDRLSYIEAKALIEQILKLDNPFNCPHGRPIIIKMTKYEIEKMFKRIQN